MIILDIDKLLEKNNKTRYWLSKQIDMEYHNVKKLCENTRTRISFDVLEKLCDTFNCTPNDILKIHKD